MKIESDRTLQSSSLVSNYPSFLGFPYFDSKYQLEFSVHRSPPSLLKDLGKVFPDISNELQKTEILIVPTFQPSKIDLFGMGVEIENEKDRLLENFLDWGSRIKIKLDKLNFWSDLIDPSSGYPFYGKRGGLSYNDLDVMQTLLHYPITQVGSCWIMEHPKWKFSVYPATFVTNAPPILLWNILTETSN